MTLSSDKLTAHRTIDAIRKANRSDRKWLHIMTKDLLDGMDKRVDNPNIIYQGVYGTCVPTAIVRDILSDAPSKYVSANLDLYYTARTNIFHGKLLNTPLSATADLRAFRPDASVHPADWLLTATLRESLNPDSDVFGMRSVEGATIDESITMLKELGYSSIKYSKTGGKDIIPPINTYKLKGYHVQLSIDASLLDKSVSGGHRVELNSTINYLGGSTDPDIQCSIWSWGRVYNFGQKGAPNNQTIKHSKFAPKLKGYVACKY